ncbi:MAG: hypothetical protein ACRYFL_14245 [Janthinobacterium lividum]
MLLLSLKKTGIKEALHFGFYSDIFNRNFYAVKEALQRKHQKKKAK